MIEKALELIGAVDHDKTFRLCIKPTFDRCHKPAQHCDRRRAERNYTRCKYEHM